LRTLRARTAGIAQRVALALLTAWLAALASRADQLPLWEAGPGLAVVDFPDYRGADERSTYVLPFPYIVYRGDVFRIDREGVRGRFLKSDEVELDLSVNASIPVKSAENHARQGMPDLDPTIEIGPTLDFTLHRGADRKSSLKLQLPLRAVMAVNLSPPRAHGVGFVFEPQLEYDLHDLAPLSGWRFVAAAGPVFGDRSYHAYYYGVDPAFATSQRPAYMARAGFGGSQLTLSTSRRFPHFWVGAFARFDWLSGAVFEDSPLVRQSRAFAAGIAFSWIFARSDTLVEADE